MKFTLKFGALFVVALVGPFTAFSANLDWTGNINDNWFNGGNWTPAGPPGVLDNARIGNNTVAVGLSRIATGGTATANRVVLGLNAGESGTLRINNGSELDTVNNLVVGAGGDGTLLLENGSLRVNTSGAGGNALVIGRDAGSNGSVILRNASIAGVFFDVVVGQNGTGNLEVHNNASVSGNGGFIEPFDVYIGRNAGSVGTVLVDGNGGGAAEFDTFDNFYVGGNAAGPGGQGELRIVNGGVVVVDGGGTIFVWGPGSGDRGTLSVDSTYTINTFGNPLSFNGGRLNFVGDGVDFINDAVLNNVPGPDQNGMFANVGDGNTATIDGQLSGNGQLVKTGTGTLVLTNLGNSYSGGTNIDNGTLVVGNGGFVFASVLGNGDVNLNGDINTRLRTPEGTPLFYLVFGNFNANTGQLYTQVGGTNSGVDSDEMGVLGNANLDPANSHLFVHRINGYNPNNGDVVDIIGTFGSVTGQFSDAPPNAPVPNDFVGLIQPFAVYGPSFVDLQFGFAATFASIGKTPNQIATGAALDAAVAAGCIIPATNVLGNIPINTLRHAYDLIAPEELASMYEASFAQSMVNSLNLQHRMDDIRWGSTGFCADGFVIQDNHGYTKNDGKSVADKNPAVEQTAPPDYRWGAFITGTGELAKVGEEGDNADGYQINQAGFTMGVDYRVTDHWAIGLSGGYSHSTAELVDDGRMNTDGGKMGLYTTYYTNGFYVDAAASGGWNQYDTRRTAFLGQETGSTDGAEFDGMVAVGYDWKKGCWTFGPTASFEYTYAEFNSFTEDTSTAASLIPLHFPDQNQSAYRSNLGFRIAHEQVMKPGEGLTVVPELRASWRHDFGSSAYAIDSNFVGCDDVFTVHGPWIGRDSAVVDLGLTAYCTPGLSAYIFYDGQFGRDNYNNNAISGGFRVAF
jgi:outer membrane autotransporter protein